MNQGATGTFLLYLFIYSNELTQRKQKRVIIE
jgi:hypothetical protein